jgi:maltose alpha-D-glucosyltransferase/alpha-amylase
MPHSLPPALEMIGPGDLWYKDAVIYSLNVETFQDSNGDGIGDFPGLTSRLAYLQGLGVTCLWLGPFYPSPGRDNGYDVADYYGVDPRLGTPGDLVDFVRQARERGIRVIIDLVVNHTSDQHSWFKSARADRESPYRDFYVWADEPPANAQEGMMFPGVETSTWTKDDVSGAYYFHRFYRHQPDLNLANPAVREQIRKIMGFWLELGVSGFRIDAAPFLIERKGLHAPHVEARRPHTLFRYMRSFLSLRRGDAALLAEANVPMNEIGEYFGDGDRVHMLFGFWLNQHLWLSLARKDATPLARAIRDLPPTDPTSQWVNFLRNHDELDLGALSAADRQTIYEAFAPDTSMRLYNRGIRRRTAPMLGNDRDLLELAHVIMLALPGTPVLYYGDEIAMGDELRLPEREGVRTPMQWSNTLNAGFSTADTERLVRPVISGGAFGYEAANAGDQRRDPDSFLNWLQRVVGVRRTCRELSWATANVLATEASCVLALEYQWGNTALLALHNLSNTPCTYHPADAWAQSHTEMVEVLSDREYPRFTGSAEPIHLGPFGYRWLRIPAIR